MARRSSMDDTKDRIVEAAQALIQTRGYNGFSYRDIAAEVGIRSASIHHHFPKKADLGAAVARRYGERFMDTLERAEAGGAEVPALLAGYTALFRDALNDDGRMCLCGILGAEAASLPGEVVMEARRFFDRNIDWLSRLFKRAGREGFTMLAAPKSEARAFLAALEGAMILAKTANDTGVFDDVVKAVLKRFGKKPRGAKS